ncbi:MAG: carbohydrate binding family 9 domain-containing protein [Candidatus Aminicenantes bacterium]|nr:carbohydrate binding family 9 domain-containing protein [Candidatus Aminicenantes bacterium]
MMYWKRKQFFTSMALVLLSALLLPASESNGNYDVKAAEFPSPPIIDGNLDEPFWDNAAFINDFTQFEPVEGGAPSEKTEAYIGYDKKNLYIAVRCYDSSPEAIRASLCKRDKAVGDDQITIYLDTFNDKKRAFAFQINPCGVQTDGIYSEFQRRRPGGGFDKIDKTWDTFFLSDATIDEEGYTIEVQIPFKSLRFPDVKSQIWGLQIQRSIQRNNEEIYWAPRSRDANGFLSQEGILRIEGELESGKNLEVMPVVTGRKTDGDKVKPIPGINLKYGMSSNFTADLTLNPDFSQIEADMPQVDVNQRYKLYYPEKRPFFLEGKDIFDTPIELLYTRDIINPLWGVKLTGKVGKTSLGFLNVFDETPSIIEIPDSSDDYQENLEHGLINVLRVKHDVFQESYIGFILMDKETGEGWDSIFRNYNRVGGIDGRFKFNEYYRFSFQVAGSQSRVQDEQTDLMPAMNFNLSHVSRHWNVSAEYTSLPEEFESSLGYLRRKDIRSFQTRLSYSILPQNDIIVNIRPGIDYTRIYDFDNNLTDNEIRIGGYVSGWRNSFIYVGVTTGLERYEGIDFYKTTLRSRMESEPFSWLTVGFSFSTGGGISYSEKYYEEEPFLGCKTSYGLRATFKPLRNLRLLYDYQNNTFLKERGGERIYRINLISQRISYQLSRTLSFRLITDYNDYYGKLYNSVLLSYELRPGTVFYLGMDDNQGRDDLGIFRNEGRYYFLKFSYWWRM